MCARPIRCSHLLAGVVVAGSVASLRADEWPSPTDMESLAGNKVYRIVVRPDKLPSERPGHCFAELQRASGGAWRSVWSRYLVNNTAPLRTYVTGTGNYVVTLDEWGSVGMLPVVIYGRRGELVRAHSLESLGLSDVRNEFLRTVGSEWWSEDSICLFGPKEETFAVRLGIGRTLVIDLTTGELITEKDAGQTQWRRMQDFFQGEVKRIALRLLESGDEHERATGALHAGQLRLTEAIPQLRRLLGDNATYTVGLLRTRKVYYVREAAKKALEAMGEDHAGTRPTTVPTTRAIGDNQLLLPGWSVGAGGAEKGEKGGERDIADYDSSK